MNFVPTLTNFQIIRPSFETSQEDIFNWLHQAHSRAEKSQYCNSDEEEKFSRSIQMAIQKFGCKSDRIKKRGHMTSDFLHNNWDNMEIYNLGQDPKGQGIGVRSRLYGKYADEILNQFYPENHKAPDDLIHVTCTGYNCPSAAQKLVSKRNWQEITTITHAYHMGCMAAMPAIRMGVGFLSSSSLSAGRLTGKKKKIDIVHTELCSLHLNPKLHTPEQLVGQSLFSDGFIKYSLVDCISPGLKVINVHEELVPNSPQAMGWECEDWGFYFTLTKEVPLLIKMALSDFLQRLVSQTDYTLDVILKKALFAIHPGGPKIIDLIREHLNLSSEQIEVSEETLLNYGNMSSATLPHIWERIIKTEKYRSKTPIIGLAFGPGLTICGILLEKA